MTTNGDDRGEPPTSENELEDRSRADPYAHRVAAARAPQHWLQRIADRRAPACRSDELDTAPYHLQHPVSALTPDPERASDETTAG